MNNKVLLIGGLIAGGYALKKAFEITYHVGYLSGIVYMTDEIRKEFDTPRRHSYVTYRPYNTKEDGVDG